MKTFTLSTLFMTFFAFGTVFGQITLTEANFPVNQTTQTVNVAMTNPSPAVGSGANQTLDYSGIGKAGVITRDFGITSAHFPAATYGIVGSSFVGSNFFYEIAKMQQVSASGYAQIGRDIPEQVYSLTSTTGGAGDYDSIPAQFNDFGVSPPNILPFPATYGDAWTSNWEEKLDLYLFVPAFGLNGSLVEIFTNANSEDSIIGYGSLIVPDAAGTGTNPAMDVLIQRRSITLVDSFYLDGQIAPVGILYAFGVNQAQSTTFLEYDVWREGFAHPYMTVRYPANASGTPSEVTYDQEVMAGLETTPFAGAVLFPNPSAQGTPSLNFLLGQVNPSVLTFELRELSGRLVETQPIQTGYDPMIQVNLANAPAAGIYLVSLKDPSGNQVLNRKWVVE